MEENNTTENEHPSIDWGKLVWFHASVILVGGVIVLPLLFYLLAEAGALGTVSARIAEKGGERILLGMLSIAPVAYGYGRDLQFSTGRFIAAVVVLGFMQITIAMRSTVLGGSALPITLGGGVVGIAVAHVVGQAGLRLRIVFQSATARRMVWGAAGTLVLVIAVLEARDYYRHLQYKEAETVRRAAEAAQQKVEWQTLLDSLEASGSPLDVAAKRDSALDRSTLTWKLNDEVELSLSLTNCVRVRFKNRDKRLPFIDRFLASRSAIEARLGNTLSVGEPIKRRTHAGAGVSRRDVARLPGYWDNGSFSSCLGDRAELEDRTAWIVDQVEAFFEILQDPLYAIRNPSPPMPEPGYQRPSQVPAPQSPHQKEQVEVEKRLVVTNFSCQRIANDIKELEQFISKREKGTSRSSDRTRGFQSDMQADLLASDREALAKLREQQHRCEQQLTDLNIKLESLKQP